MELTQTPEVVSFREEYAPRFEALNRAWIEQYFALEEPDRALFRDPRRTIVEPGGQIFFVVVGGEVLGACAAIRHSARVYELAKMAVSPRAQGRGYGSLLVEAVVRFARDAGAEVLMLVSNSRLRPALRLYEKHGFRPVPVHANPGYARVDVQMELDLTGTSPACSASGEEPTRGRKTDNQMQEAGNMARDRKKLDAVFEGGGVKGIGLVGAVAATEAQGFHFENVAGTSAGAIVAALIAAGCHAGELKRILDGLDYTQFKDRDLVDRIPLLGSLLSVGLEKGIYEGDFFEGWLRDLLAKKNVHTFGDLVMEEYKDDPKYRYKLQVIATDLSRGRLLVLPRDIARFGINPDALGVARAVRMSMSIPFFFEPVVLQDGSGAPSYIVDGGVLSNYPVWLFDDGTPDPPWPTLGYKLVDPDEGKPRAIRGPLTLFAALFATMMEAHDARYIEDKNFARTVPIPTLGVQTTEFELGPEQAGALYQSEVTAAQEFFQKWDFEAYKERYRRTEPPERQDRVLASPAGQETVP
jgi:NTE family protein